MSDQHPEYIRQHAGPFYDAVMSLVKRHDPLDLIRLGLSPGEYAPPVGTIVQRLKYEFTPPLDIVYQEFRLWARLAGRIYQRQLGTRESFRPIAEEIAALTEEGMHNYPAERLRVFYRLTGDFDPHAVAAQIGIEPDAARRKGDPVSPRRSGHVMTFSYVHFESGLPNDADVESQVAALLARLRPAWEAFVDLGRRYDAEIMVVLASDETTGPAMGLSVEDMRAFIELNAGVDVDIYSFT